MKNKTIPILCTICLLLFVACKPKANTEESKDAPTAKAQMVNPASANCVNKGGKLEIRNEVGGQVGYCTLPNGTVCEEWAYYRNECPSQN